MIDPFRYDIMEVHMGADSCPYLFVITCPPSKGEVQDEGPLKGTRLLYNRYRKLWLTFERYSSARIVVDELNRLLNESVNNSNLGQRRG